MSKLYPTVREVRQYADEMREKQGKSGDELEDLVYDFVYNHTSPGMELQDTFYLEDDYDHIYMPAVNEKGYPILLAFKNEDWKIGKPDPEYNMEIPITRGFSDSADTQDTEMSNLDVQCACDMERNKKVYPWQLKQIYSANDLGLEEEEYDELLAESCGM